MQTLPIYNAETQILDALTSGNRLILEAPTGSGKSTQVPQMLLNAGITERDIIVLQPRRIAARMLARRVAQEVGCPLGKTVGYHVRFDRKCSDNTRIIYETDGILMRQLLSDPTIPHVGAIVFDEFHERHLYGDIMLALAIELQATTRPDLKLIVMSATLNSNQLETYLSPCPVIRSEGRTFPVDIQYLKSLSQKSPPAIWDLAADHCSTMLQTESDGDVLIFMPGAHEIRKTIQALERTLSRNTIEILPLYGDLSPEQQDRAVMPSSKRRVIVSTNVAETSLTIDGVTLVIDSGQARKARFDPHRGINTLLIEKISKSSADQRAGRAGRVRAGACMRLWTEADHRNRADQECPEIQSVDLSETVLSLTQHGIADPRTFNWMDSPDPVTLARSIQLLADLDACVDGAVTDLGKRMIAFPMHPRYSRMFLAGEHFGCLPRVALMTALLQERSILIRTNDRQIQKRRETFFESCTQSDVLCLIRAFEYAEDRRFDISACRELGIHAGSAKQCARLRDQFLATAKRLKMDLSDSNPDPAALLKCLLTGFSDQVAFRASMGTTRCSLVHNRRGTLEKSSIVKQSPLLIASEINEIGKRGENLEVRLSVISAIEQTWLTELFPEAIKTSDQVVYDTDSRRVRVLRRTSFRDLVLDESRSGEPSKDQAAEVLAQEVLIGNISLKNWTEKVESWIARVNLIAEYCPDMQVTPIDDDARLQIFENICHGGFGAKDIKHRDVWNGLDAWLSKEQKDAVTALAPERVTLTNGRSPKVVYAAGEAPKIALRVQELYDVNAVPTLAMGAVTPLVHILAPNQRVVQITDDMRSFWNTSYPQIKKDLKGRYPKHEWR